MDLRIDKTAKNMNTIKSTIQQSIDGVKRIEVWDTHRHTHKHTHTSTNQNHTPKSHSLTHRDNHTRRNKPIPESWTKLPLFDSPWVLRRGAMLRTVGM